MASYQHYERTYTLHYYEDCYRGTERIKACFRSSDTLRGIFPEIRDLFTNRSRKLLFPAPITIPSQQYAKLYDSFYRG